MHVRCLPFSAAFPAEPSMTDIPQKTPIVVFQCCTRQRPHRSAAARRILAADRLRDLRYKVRPHIRLHKR